MEQRAMVGNSPPISGVLTRTDPDFITNPDEFRKYVSAYVTSMILQGRPESSSKSIVYNIGARDLDVDVLMVNNLAVEWRIAQTVRMAETSAEQLQGIIRRHANFTGDFRHMDLSSIGYQLAKAIACYTINGILTIDMVRGGRPLSVRSLNTRDAPINSADACVFIPRTVDNNGRGGTFAALTAAANSHGSMVYTDTLNVDGNNAPVIDAPNGSRLALACTHGLRILLSMYDSNSNGPTMAFAITKGFHEILSVVGHTDEGAWFRKALRRGGFIAPHGGVYPELASSYIGLPIPTENQPSTFVALADTICLTTAGAVAVSDPCLVIDGRKYPTISTSEVAEAVPAGNTQEGGPDDVNDHLNRILQTFGDFSANYIKALGSLFSVDGDYSTAANFLRQSVCSLINSKERHLQYKTVAPFFWIEPTSLLIKSGTVADMAGFGVLVGPEESYDMPTFEELRVIDNTSLIYNFVAQIRSPRTSGLLLHLSGNIQDGLAYLVPRQFLTDRLLNKGGTRTADAARLLGSGMQEYLWGRGHSGMMVPGENVYIGGALGLTAVQATVTDYNIRSNHIPTSHEVMGSVKVTCHRPTAMPKGNLRAVTQNIRRSRNLAGNALNNAVDSMSRSAWTGGEPFATANVEPSVRRPAEPVVRPAGIRDIERLEYLPAVELSNIGAPQPIVMQMREARTVVAHGAKPIAHNAQLAADAIDPVELPPDVVGIAETGDAAAAGP